MVKKQNFKKNISKNFNKKIILISSIVFIVSLFFLIAINSFDELSISDLTKNSINKLTGFTGFAVFEEEFEEICEENCESSGYNCGTQMICNVSVDCGSCESGYECVNGECGVEEISEIICSPACREDEECVEGICQCDAGYELVEGVCIEIAEEVNETEEIIEINETIELNASEINISEEIINETIELNTSEVNETSAVLACDPVCGTGYGCINGTCVFTCTDTCISLGYECGTRTICNISVDCGTCNEDESCESGVCEAVEEDEEDSVQISVADFNANSGSGSSDSSSESSSISNVNTETNTENIEVSAEETGTAESSEPNPENPLNLSGEIPLENSEDKGFIGKISMTGLNILKTIKEKALSPENRILKWSIILAGILLFFGIIIFYSHRKNKSASSK